METKTASQQRIKRLYHYQRFDAVRLAQVFTGRALYCSNPKDLNDPWDCRPHYSKGALQDVAGRERAANWFGYLGRKYFPQLPGEEHERRERLMRADAEFLEARIDELTLGMWKAIQNQYRVYCLTPHPDSPLMWAHYADSHRGLCLEYSVDNLLMCGALPVRYATTYPTFDATDANEDAALSALLTKSTDWSYEHEFRLIAAAPGYIFPGMLRTVNNFVDLPDHALTSIIAGCLMPETDRQIVQALVKGAAYPVSIQTTHRVADRYSLEIKACP